MLPQLVPSQVQVYLRSQVYLLRTRAALTAGKWFDMPRERNVAVPSGQGEFGLLIHQLRARL